jgi:hypothetical protein
MQLFPGRKSILFAFLTCLAVRISGEAGQKPTMSYGETTR